MTGESGTFDDRASRLRAWSLSPFRHRPTLRLAVLTLAYGVLIYGLAAAMLSASRWFGGVELLWLANPIAIVTMIRRPRAHWPLLLGVTGVALILANGWRYSDPESMIGYGLINLVSITIVASIIRLSHPDPRLLRGYGTIVLIALAGAALITALFVQFRLLMFGTVTTVSAVQWFAANAMGLIVLLPALKATRRVLSEEFDVLSPPVIVVIALTAVLAGVVFTMNSYPVLFLLLPCGVFSALLYRFAGAAASTITISIIATASTLMGVGPIAELMVPPPGRILYLQLFVGAFTLTTFQFF